MKSLFKVTLLATTMAVALNAPLTFAADTATKAAPAAESKSAFKNDDQKSAYALGASLGRYMENSLKEQEKLGIKLDKSQLIAGVQDAFADKSKLSDQEIEQTLQAFETRVKTAAQQKMEKDATENEAKGKTFRDSFAKEKGVKTSKTGLLYKVEKEGTGDAPKDSDTVVVNYKGTLIDGKRIMDSILQAHPDVKGVICGNGPVALGAIAALKAANRSDVIVVGIDGSNDERDAVKAGTLQATVMLQAQAIAAQGVTDLDNYLQKGEKPAKQRVMFRGILITQDNADKVQDFNIKS